MAKTKWELTYGTPCRCRILLRIFYSIVAPRVKIPTYDIHLLSTSVFVMQTCKTWRQGPCPFYPITVIAHFVLPSATLTNDECWKFRNANSGCLEGLDPELPTHRSYILSHCWCGCGWLGPGWEMLVDKTRLSPAMPRLLGAGLVYCRHLGTG